MANTEGSMTVKETCLKAKEHSGEIAFAGEDKMNMMLIAAAHALRDHAGYIIAENQKDVDACTRGPQFADRLMLNEKRIDGIAAGLEKLVQLNGESDGGAVRVSMEMLEQCLSRKSLLYDKKGEEHYNLISALHKSMRNSDPDAAVYWLARMLEAGEDPLYIARRITRFASEDVGLADPHALGVTIDAWQACHFLGMPECAVHLAQAVVYLSVAPKSNSIDRAYALARKDALSMLDEPVPLALRNAPTKLMKELDYGKGYQFAHHTRERLTAMHCLPESLLGKEYYHPTEQGLEVRFKNRLEQIKAWKKEHDEQP